MINIFYENSVTNAECLQAHQLCVSIVGAQSNYTQIFQITMFQNVSNFQRKLYKTLVQ